MRDLLAHHYYRVDVKVIRRTVEAPLLELQDAVAQLIVGELIGPDTPE